MKIIKNIFIVLLGLIIGLWFGLNIGKNKPFFSNPFGDKSLQEKLKRTGKGIIEKSGKVLEKSGAVLEKSGKALRDRVKD